MAESKKIIMSLLEIASCPVCFERLWPSASCCINGHAVCGKCKVKITKCPTCKEKFSEEKHTTLHQILEALPFSCRFRGCAELIQDRDYHEKWCGFRRTLCLVPRCQWSGMANEIRNHVENKHSLSDTAVDNYHYINRDFTWIYARVQHGQVFWDIRQNDLKAKMFSIQIIWVPNGEVKEDVFQVKVEFKSGATKFVATNRILFNPNQVSGEGNSLIFHTEMLKPFTENNDIYYQLHLSKD